MTNYQAVPGNEFSVVYKPTTVKRKPVAAAYQPTPPAANASQDHAKDSQVLVTALTTNVESKRAGGASSTVGHSRRLGIWRLWKWELLSLAASASFLIAIIVTLREFNDKDLSAWKAPISINTVISVLSVLFKGSLGLPVAEGISQLKWLWFSDRTHRLSDLDRFNRASRSTWGAARFLVRQFGSGRLSMLASFGASLALITLAVDPFAQASVSVVTCQRVVAAPAKIPRANVYSANGGQVGQDYRIELDSPMQVAFTLGTTQPLANSSRSVEADVVCPTTNCTFPGTQGAGAAFMTLDMCHTCVNVSASIVRGQESDGLYWSLPPPPNRLLNRPLGLWGQPEFDSAINMTASPDAIEFQGTRSDSNVSLVSFQGLVRRNTNMSCTAYLSCDWMPFAFDCSLQPCVKTYAANVSNGVYAEVELSRQHLQYTARSGAKLSPGPGPLLPSMAAFQLAVDKRIVDDAWVACEGSTTRSALRPIEVPPGGGSWYERECVYSVRAGAAFAMAVYFADLVSNARVTQRSGTVYGGDAWMKMLWNGGNVNMTTVDRFAKGVADALGAQMRRAAEPADAEDSIHPELPVAKIPNDVWVFANGLSYQSRPCIRVDWRWLSFLGILFLAELVFMMLLIIANRRSRWSGDWKSSTLALLLHPWNRSQAPAEEAGENSLELSRAADGTQATLSQLEGKWRLISI